MALLKKPGAILEVDYDQFNKNILFNLVTKEELAKIQQIGVDI